MARSLPHQKKFWYGLYEITYGFWVKFLKEVKPGTWEATFVHDI